MSTTNHHEPVAVTQDGSNEDTIHHIHMRVALDLVCNWNESLYVSLLCMHVAPWGGLDLVVELKLNIFFYFCL